MLDSQQGPGFIILRPMKSVGKCTVLRTLMTHMAQEYWNLLGLASVPKHREGVWMLELHWNYGSQRSLVFLSSV